MSAKHTRLFVVTYLWRQRYWVDVKESRPLNIEAATMREAVSQATARAKSDCRSAGDVFVRLASIKDSGVLR